MLSLQGFNLVDHTEMIVLQLLGNQGYRDAFDEDPLKTVHELLRLYSVGVTTYAVSEVKKVYFTLPRTDLSFSPEEVPFVVFSCFKRF